MAKTGKVGGLSAKLGAAGRKAFDKTKGNETKLPGGGSLPDGIENGIAQLVDIKFGTYEKGDNQGQLFFMAAGVVVEPKKHGNIPIEGLRTQIGPEPICETPGKSRESVEDHMDWILNELRKLGLDTDEIDYDDLEGACESLVEAAPHFRFRTWKGQKATSGKYKGLEPLLQQTWAGVVEYEGSEDDEVVDDTTDDTDVEEEEEEEEEAPAPKKKSTTKSQAKKAPVKKAPPVKKKPAKKAEPTPEELGALADDGDEDAMVKLQVLADENEVDHESIPTWAEVAQAIIDAEGGEVEPDEEEEVEEGDEEEAGVEKGDVVKYKPPKTKKASEFEVIFVNDKTGTVNLKSLDDGKKHLNVSMDALV